MKIDVILPCGPKAEEYSPFVIDNILSTATTHEFNFILPQHKSDIKFLDSHPRVKRIVEMADDVNAGIHSASEAHGRSVNVCAKLVETDLVLIIDNDFVFLSRGWDRWFVEQFDDSSVGIVGTEYHPAMRGAQKYLNYPTLIMSMMRTKLIGEFDIDFCPQHKQTTVDNEQKRLQYDRPSGFVVSLDTGVELAQKLRPAGIKGVTLKYVHDGGALPIGQNFYESGVLANHMKSGTMQKDETIENWKKLVTDFLRDNQ